MILLVFVAQRLVVSSEPSKPAPTFNEFTQQIADGDVAKATIKVENKRSTSSLKDKTKFTTGYPEDYSDTLVGQLESANVPFEVKGIPSSPWWSSLIWLAPFILFIGFWIYLMNRMQGGGSKVMSFGKSRAKRMAVDAPKITFKDVAGADEAVEELHEIKEFLENPKKFQALGARIPKGVLLFGPPGTGKTLLARAVAGEAGVPFFSISGSDFVEMFVGVGASRVRDLFEQAKQSSPCIIFMDEIDAVGRHRGAGLGGGHDEREQTLNQLLVEMDGFEAKDNIILIAATNRPDILDPALLRPGRFDRQIVVDRPDREGRAQILRSTPRASRSPRRSTSTTLAGQTPGFTGADLANLVNEAALLAARKGKRLIDQTELEEGIMRVIAGPEKKCRLLSEKERRRHGLPRDGPRAGGALPPQRRPGPQDLGRLPRPGPRLHDLHAGGGQVPHHPGPARGPMAMTLGGRAAEELVFDEITTGAANDLEKVTQTAKQMTMRFGMSDKLGPRVLGHNHGAPFLGRDMHSEPDYSDDMARTIDSEIRRIIEEAHQRARDILVEHRGDLETLAQILLGARRSSARSSSPSSNGEAEEARLRRARREESELGPEAEQAGQQEKKAKRLPYPGAGEPLAEG